MEKIKTIEDVRLALQDTGPVVGFGVTAFPRVGVAGLVPDYRILAISESADLAAIRRKVEVVTVKRDLGGRVEKLNTLALLKLKSTQNYLKSLGDRTKLFVYKSSKNIEKIADRLEMGLLSPRSGVRDEYEDKWTFRKAAVAAGVELIAGEQMLIDELTEAEYGRLKIKLGGQLVFQITDYSKGGGIGTFFISNREDFSEFKAFVERRRAAERDLKRVNVTKFIEGESASITGCATRYGVLTSRVQRQIIDIPEVVGYHGRNGVFCGHDWGDRYGASIQKKAESLAGRLGEYMYRRGYRGIFGIDLVVNRETSEVSLVECNSRYTAAFPIYSMLQEKNGEIPIDAWHLLEQAGVDYRMNFEDVQAKSRQVKTGAQLILHNLERAWVAVRGEVKAGVYRIKTQVTAAERGKASNQLPPRSGARQETIEWVREGYSLAQIQAQDEFVLTDGVPHRNLRLKPGARLGRVLFLREVMEENGNELKEEVKQAMKELYRRFKLEKIKRKAGEES